MEKLSRLKKDIMKRKQWKAARKEKFLKKKLWELMAILP
jgi:hypothetical protein